MSYLVMECHQGYAVVLDNQGRFLKVANMGYEVGQRVDRVIEAQEQKSMSLIWQRQAVKLLAAAACLCLIFLGSWRFLLSTYGTVRMQINPDVQISVNRLDYVTGLEGLNKDGEELVKGVGTFGKKIDEVSNELADKAVEKGFLKEGGKISLTVKSGNGKWQTATEERLLLELDVHFEHSITIEAPHDGETKNTPPSEEIKIPVSSDDDADDAGDDDADDSDDADDGSDDTDDDADGGSDDGDDVDDGSDDADSDDADAD